MSVPGRPDLVDLRTLTEAWRIRRDTTDGPEPCDERTPPGLTVGRCSVEGRRLGDRLGRHRHGVGLQAVQEVHSLLRMGAGCEDRPLVLLQHHDPMRQVG